MKKQSFAAGAALLALAIGLGKIFSAVFKIPLDRLFLQAEGMAIFNSAYNVYTLFFAVATAGIPMAVSSLIAASHSRDEENTVLSTALIFTESVLVVAFFIIFVFSEKIAHLTGIPDASLSFKVMAPALIFCGITASFRGFFQGKRIMTPSALSQVSDSFGRLLVGFILVYVFSRAPLKVSSAAAMCGIPFGAMLSALILVVTFILSGERLKFSFSSDIVKKILFLAMPITLTSSLHPLFNMADTLTVVPILNSFSSLAQAAFGHLSRAATLYALPVSIATAVSSSILPAISENLKNNNYSAVNYESSLAVKLAIVISAPCAAGFMAISGGILNLLYDNAVNYQALIFIAPSAIFASVGSVLSCILQGFNKTKYTVISAIFACGTKIVINLALIPVMGVWGAALSTSVSYIVFTLSLLVFLSRCTSVTFSPFELVLKPALCAFLCFITAFIASFWLHTVLSILLAAVVYIPLVFITSFITPKEFKQIFGGQ